MNNSHVKKMEPKEERMKKINDPEVEQLSNLNRKLKEVIESNRTRTRTIKSKS